MENEPSHASFRFYAELNDHLLAEQQYKTLEKTFFTPSTVKDMIESFGVSHTEIDLIVANGQSVEFSYLVRNGDRIAVYATFESFDVRPEQRLRPQPLRNPKFILDVHFGKAGGILANARLRYRVWTFIHRYAVGAASANEHPILLLRVIVACSSTAPSPMVTGCEKPTAAAKSPKLSTDSTWHAPFVRSPVAWRAMASWSQFRKNKRKTLFPCGR